MFFNFFIYYYKEILLNNIFIYYGVLFIKGKFTVQINTSVDCTRLCEGFRFVPSIVRIHNTYYKSYYKFKVFPIHFLLVEC